MAMTKTAAVYSTTESDLTEDVKTLQFRLALEGCEWDINKSPLMKSPLMIWLHHPQRGTTWFSGWDMLSRHCDAGWKDTYWPPQ